MTDGMRYHRPARHANGVNRQNVISATSAVDPLIAAPRNQRKLPRKRKPKTDVERPWWIERD
jgi:hypothetical protein